MAAERAGIPAVVNVCQGFIAQAHAIAELGGVPWEPVVSYPGHIDTYSLEQRNKYISELVAPGSEEALTTQIEGGAAVAEAPETDIAFKGNFEEVLTYYREKMWSDGLPIIPPTVEKVEEFLKYTDYPADAILTRPLEPSYRVVTPWTVAVNGVMAGCRPEYMPVLIAMTKAWAEPSFQIMQASSTAGWGTFSILSGPLKKQLGVNYQQGYAIPGLVSNTSMGRFYNIFKRNVLKVRVEPPSTDKGSYGIGAFNLIAEDDELCREYGWKTLAEEQGFQYEDNVVHTMGCKTQTGAQTIKGITGKEVMDRVIQQVVVGSCFQGDIWNEWFMFAITPVLAEVIAKDGYSKDDMRDYFYKNARRTAMDAERVTSSPEPGYYCRQVQEGILPQMFCESEDPNRMVPIFVAPERIRFIITGDPGRNRVMAYLNAKDTQGRLTSMKVELPKNWDALYNDSQLKKDLENSGLGVL